MLQSHILAYNQRMILGNQPNKQNNNPSSNGIRSRQFNKSKSNLLQFNYQGQYSAINESFAENISLKIYQERVKNRTLFDKIKSKVNGFKYQLIVPAKFGDSEQVLMREYGRLLQENQFLQKEWSKIEFFLDAATEKETSNYDFLINAWQHRGVSEFSQSEEIIDRLNKTVLLIKRGIDSTMIAEKQRISTGKKENETVKSDQFFQMEGKLEALKQLLQKKDQQIVKNKQNYEQKLLKYEQQNTRLAQKLAVTQRKLKDYSQKQKELYEDINRLSKLIFQKEKALNQAKEKKHIYRRYISESVDENQDLLFQLIIKSKTLAANTNHQLQPIIIQKQLSEIEDFLGGRGGDESLRYSLQFFNQKSISDVSIDSEVSISETNLNDIAGLISLLQDNSLEHQFSSTKKRQRFRTGDLSSSKFISNRKSSELQEGTRQLKFIRRK